MTNIEHMMLSMCFGMNIGWLIGSIIILITDGIKTLKQKHKMKKEQQNTEVKGKDRRQSMTMDVIATFINKAADFTSSAIVLILCIFALAAVWKWLIGLCIKFIHWLCPGLTKHKQNDSSNKEK